VNGAPSGPAADLGDVLAVVAEALPAAGIRCLLVGGFAVNHYGYTRNTLDIDWMVASDDIGKVRRIMRQAGFTNQSVHENVVFFSRPGSSLRVDFLRVDRDTLQQLLAQAVEVTVFQQTVRVPSLRDLLAMKLFALAHAPARRVDKDLPDVAYLAILNDLDVERDLAPLCERYASSAVLQLVREKIEALRP
jgi:hypothetical protein